MVHPADAARGGRFSLQDRQDADAVEVPAALRLRALHVQHLHHGREEVHGHHGVPRDARAVADDLGRPRDDARDAVAAFPHVALPSAERAGRPCAAAIRAVQRARRDVARGAAAAAPFGPAVDLGPVVGREPRHRVVVVAEALQRVQHEADAVV